MRRVASGLKERAQRRDDLLLHPRAELRKGAEEDTTFRSVAPARLLAKPSKVDLVLRHDPLRESMDLLLVLADPGHVLSWGEMRIEEPALVIYCAVQLP